MATVRRNAVFADAYRFAEDNVQKAPANWRAQYNWAEALMKRGRDAEGIAAYEEAVRLNPDQGSGRVSLGALYVQRKRYDDAERVLEPAMHHPEESVVAAAAQNLSGVYVARGDAARATQALTRSLQLKPEWTAVRRQLAALYARQEDWIQAAREYNEVLRLNPKLMSQVARPAAVANFKAGILFAGDRQFEVASNLFGNALQYDPSLWRARGYLAYVSIHLNDWARAERELKQIEREHPGDPWTAEALQRVSNLLPIVPPPPA
jgi:tetratricopeptide (TPR) repeat protein